MQFYTYKSLISRMSYIYVLMKLLSDKICHFSIIEIQSTMPIKWIYDLYLACKRLKGHSTIHGPHNHIDVNIFVKAWSFTVTC